MPVTIGGKRESDFSDPLGMLSDCHRRIERFLHALIAIAGERQGGPLDAAQRASLETSLRYFRDAAPRHTADEEVSLFPRLRRMQLPELEATLAQLDTLEHDHQHAEAAHQEVDRLGQAWLTRGRLSSEEISRLQALLAGLAQIYERHIALEDHEVFPSAQRLLSPSDRTEVGSEMAARRGVAASTPTKPNGR